MRTFVGRRPVLAYFGLAYVISWSLWLPLIATVQGWWEVAATLSVGVILVAIAAIRLAGPERLTGLSRGVEPQRQPVVPVHP